MLGGLALLLYGLRLAGEGLHGATASRFRHLLGSVTGNRLLSVATGALATAIIPSSGAATMMLISLVSSGIMTSAQAMALILGADVGATLAVQLLAFPLRGYTLLFIIVGTALSLFSRRRSLRMAGLVVLGLGFMFLGLKVLTEGMAPLRSHPGAVALLAELGQTPLWVFVLSALLAALISSSTAAIGVAIAFASHGLLPLEAALPVVLGANLGACVTPLLSSLGAPVEARRVAVAHTLFKAIGVAIALPLLEPFASLVSATAGDLPRQIANAHTLFNLALVPIFLPVEGPFARGLAWVMRDGAPAETPGAPRYLDPLVLDSPPLALGQATRETLRMADFVQEMLRDTIRVFREDSLEILERIEQREQWVDTLNREIKLYITRISEASLGEEYAARESGVLTVTHDLETIGDIIDNNLMELAKKKVYQGLRFSEQGLKEISALHEQVSRNLELAITAFASQDISLAQQVLAENAQVNRLEREFSQAHIHRLHAGLRESIETSAIHLDLLTNLRRINSHVTSIAYPILETRP